MTFRAPPGPKISDSETPTPHYPHPIWKTHRQQTNCIIKNDVNALDGAKMSGGGVFSAHGGTSSGSFLALTLAPQHHPGKLSTGGGGVS